MISANKALELILSNTVKWGTITIPFYKANNRILQENITADRDFPPFNRVSMDGIGVAFSQIEKGKTKFKIAGLQAAGLPQMELTNIDECLEVMTGAITPLNIDAVIPYEEIEIENGIATIKTCPKKKWENIHTQAFDKRKGAVLIEKGKRLSPAEIGVLATLGKTNVKVSKLPRVAIVSSGDELIDVDKTPEIHQIRKSNVWALKADLGKLGIHADMFHLVDSKEMIKASLSHILNEFDVVLMSGGVSKGKLDFIPEILDELKVKKVFHRVKQRPGKPLWFGVYNDRVRIFAFPGNPVSTYSNFHRYFIPWLYKSLNAKNKELFRLKLSEDFNFTKSLTYFLQVKLVQTPDGLQAKPVVGKGSGDLANLMATDGFLVIPESENHCSAGAEYEYIAFRNVGL